MRNSIPIILTVFVQFSILWISCKSVERTAPENPPVESLSYDLGFFKYVPDSVSFYNDASALVTPWIHIINDSIGFQRYFYTEALTSELNYQDQDTWLAIKTQVIDESTYVIKLFEIVDADTLYSKFFLSKDPIYTDVILLDGISYTDQTGNWSINQIDTAETFHKVVTIDYRFAEANLKSIKFLFNQQGNFNGNSILIKDSVDGVYTNYMEVFEKIDDNTSYIQWNSNTFEGRIKDMDLYGDLNWRCWDVAFINSGCSD